MNNIHDKLSLCWGSLDGVNLDGFLRAAAGAGFKAVTLNSALYKEAKNSGLTDEEFAQKLQSNGLNVSDIDPLFNWLPSSVSLPGDDVIAVCTQTSMYEVFELAHLVNTDLVNAPLGLASPDSEQQIIDCFAELCEKAQQENLRVCLEFMPFNQVSNLTTASRIVTKAGFTNGGIMFDCWHHHRGGGTAAELLELPGEQLFAVQLDDALPEPMDNVIDETLNHRLLPGEGCIDLVQMVKNIESIGANVTYDVEVFNTPLRSFNAAQRAQRLRDASELIMAQL